MSFLTLLAPGAGRRQAKPNARLVAKNRRLQDKNRELKHQVEGAGEFIQKLCDDEKVLLADLEIANAERAILQRGFDKAMQRISDMEETARIAAEQAAGSVTVAPMVRDTSDQEDQATAPIDVRAARQQWATQAMGLVVPIPPATHASSCGLGAIGVQARGCACQPVLVGGAV